MFSHLSIQELLFKLEESGDQVPPELIQTILSKGQEIVPPLCQVLEDSCQHLTATDNRWWMPIHAVKLLGTLADPQALPQLILTLIPAGKLGIYWIMEDMPTVFGRIGPHAIDPLMEFIITNKKNNDLWWSRSTASDGLVAIALFHPPERGRILSFLNQLFSEDDDPEFLTFAGTGLMNLNDPSSYPVLEKAFDLGIIDEFIFNREDLQQMRIKPIEKKLAKYNYDLLSFYDPEEIADRKARRENEEAEEIEQQQHADDMREKREASIAIELKRLEIITKLSELNISTPIKKVGRNESCPCGSGKKFKKCCFLLLKNLPPKRVLDEDYHHYTTSKHIHRANSSDIILVLENLTVLAFEAEGDEDASGAFELFRILEPLAEQQGMSDKLLKEWGIICCDHSELGEDGLVIMRRLQSLYEDKDRLQWAYTIMDTANYLADMGKLNEGKKEYERIVEQMPDFLQAYIDYANFLESNGCIDEAVDQYKQVLRMEAQTGEISDEENLAAKEL
ncbi:MAG: DUF1186 domain-containing protein, partial [Methanosarcinales archaeon]|nr:DUF1186 domain-containing protein [Methanosarcinales archaeon]